MARPKTSIPKYALHKSSGQAVAYVGGKTFYLGKFDSPASRRAYGELLARLASGTLLDTQLAAPLGGVTVNELCLKFVTDELPRYSSSEQHCQRTAIRLLRHMFGDTP